MSALDQKQICAVHQPMSALPPIADMCCATRDVRLGPKADRPSLDHSVRAYQEGLRDRKPERLSGRQVNNEIELGRLLNWKIGRLCATQYLVNIFRSATEQVRKVWSIRHQTADLDVFLGIEHRRQPRAQRQCADANPIGSNQWIVADVKGVCTTLKSINCCRDILGTPYFRFDRVKTKCASRCQSLMHIDHSRRIIDICHNRDLM